MAKRKGFGLVHREVMCNRNLSLKAKGVYGYLCACAGNKGVCYPSRDLLSSHLNVSGSTITSLIDELEKEGAVKRFKKRDEKGKFLKNVYVVDSQLSDGGLSTADAPTAGKPSTAH